MLSTFNIDIWPFNKGRTTTQSIGEQLKTDYHAHWLPGIDDGAKTMVDALEMIKRFESLGYQKLVATPHIMFDLYPNTPELIRTRLEEVKEAVRKAGIQIELEAAAEYMLDEGFNDHIDNGGLLCIRKNWVLVEQSTLNASPGVTNTLFKLQIKGYQPVIAHPERYGYLQTANLDKFKDFKHSGCLLQLNALSLTGYYGKPTQLLAEALLKNKLYSLVGSDAHHMRHLDKLSTFNINVSELKH